MNVKDIDLNLLVALERLLSLKSVSQAARELGVTQPAMSNILARLRRTFNDELLVKVGREMEPTPKAQSLILGLKQILLNIQSNILDGAGFDATKDPFHFKLAFHDYEQLIIYSQILPVLLKSHPGITIEHVPPRTIHPAEDLGSGAADFATGPVVRDRGGIVRAKLFSDEFVCLADRRNKMLKKEKLSLELLAQLEHIFIAPHGGVSGQADVLLARKKLARKVRLSVTEFSTTPWLLLNTDLIVIIPSRGAKVFAGQHRDLEIHGCPLKLDPVEIWLTWHERLNNSKPHQWLKALIIQSFTGT